MFSWGRSKKKEECWNALASHKTWRIRNHPININNTHILYATDVNVGENGIVFYDIARDRFDISKYPPQMTPEYHSYCKHKDFIYLFEVSGSIIRFNIRSRKFQYITNTKNRRRIGRYSACINVMDSDVIHIFGGLENQYHLMYSITENAYKTGTDFGVKLENPNVMYLESTHQLLMFSGYANKSYFVGKILGPDVVEWEISKHLEVPNKLRDCGQILYQDHVLIFGGMSANTQYSNEVFMLSLREHNFGELTLLKNVQCPSKDKFYALLVGDKIHLFGLWRDVKHHALSTKAIDSQLPALRIPLVSPLAPPVSPLVTAGGSLSSFTIPISRGNTVSPTASRSRHSVCTEVAPAADHAEHDEYPEIPSDPELNEDEDEKLEHDTATKPRFTDELPPGDPVFQSLQSQIDERDQRILELEEENQMLRNLVAQIQKSRNRLDSMSYKKWNAEQIASWISKLDNGMFAHFYQKLLDRMKDDSIEGGDLKDINTHSDWKRYGITKFNLRKVLIQHVSDLIDNDMYEADGSGQVTPNGNDDADPDPNAKNQGLNPLNENDEDVMPPGTFEEGQPSMMTGNSGVFTVNPKKRRMTPYV